MAYYLIDYENIRTIEGFHTLGEEDTVIFFYTKNANSLSFDLHREILSSTAKIEYAAVATGRNALDFQLSSYLGYLIAKYPEETFVILSKDHGFSALVYFWHQFDPTIRIFREERIRPHRQSLPEVTPTEALPAAPILPKIAPAPETPLLATPTEASDETPDETPIETPDETPIEVPVEATAETPIEMPIETPDEAPVEAPVETPVEKPAEAPVEKPVEKPAETPVKKPVKASLPKAKPQKQKKQPPVKDEATLKGEVRNALKTELALTESEIDTVFSIIDQYKTKISINVHLSKHFKDSEKVGKIQKLAKPLLKTKN